MDSALTASIGYYFLTKLQHGESKLIIDIPILFVWGFCWFGLFKIFESDKFSLNVVSTGLPTQ